MILPAPCSPARLLLYGVLAWLVPFFVAVPLMDRDGRSVLPLGVFKSLMLVIGSAVGAALLVRVFRQPPAFKPAGLLVGVLWLGLKVGLDLAILLPLSGMPLPTYAGELALRDLVIVIMAVAIDRASVPAAPEP